MLFNKELRVSRSGDFRIAFEQGHRFRNGTLFLIARPNGLDHPRLGISVGRKHGNAVRRNRIKRLIREAFRQTIEHHWMPTDLIVMPQRDATIESLHDLETPMNSLLARVGKEIKSLNKSR